MSNSVPDSLSLGQAIALVYNREILKLGWPAKYKMSEQDSELVRVRNCLHSSITSLAWEKPVFPQTSSNCCQGNTLLHQHKDFLIMLFMNNASTLICQQLAGHLNTCLNCFEIFCDVLRDFAQIRGSDALTVE